MPDKPNEFSYFRARGRSIEAIKKTIAAQKTYDSHITALANECGARRAEVGIGKKGEIAIVGFWFDPEQTIDPQDWDIFGKEELGTGETVTLAKPKPYTQARVRAEATAKTLENTTKNRYLDRVFRTHLDSCPFPQWKTLPLSPDCNRNFFRARTKGKQSSLNLRFTDSSTIPSPHKEKNILNRIEYIQLGKEPIIRVPNDRDGVPLFVPPNSIIVALEDLQKKEKELIDSARITRAIDLQKRRFPVRN